MVTSAINDPGQGLIPFYNDQLVPQGVWVANSFNLFNELPQVRTITRIVVGGTGWNFESDVDNVSIQGTMTNAFSHPGELLWMSYFPPAQYTWSFVSDQRAAVLRSQPAARSLATDTLVWEYDFPVQTNEAFCQTNGTHLLAVRLCPEPGTTSAGRPPLTNWNDDAVFGHVDNAVDPVARLAGAVCSLPARGASTWPLVSSPCRCSLRRSLPTSG